MSTLGMAILAIAAVVAILAIIGLIGVLACGQFVIDTDEDWFE